ncbi:hypothetical protein AB0F36_22030 [Streptomyces sp. NPDC029080]|uniref:hypothetical protein n=1 Tax=Streptomyces sp. NPDC029080 TaxID=3155017 RepID=UPI00340DF619
MRKANVMFGALLHGANRLRQGEEPTALGQLLLDWLRMALSEDDVKEWGRVYREAVTERGSAVGVPEVLTGRPVSRGYDFADLAEDLPAVDAEWRAQSNWSTLDEAALAEGGEFDPAGFVEGMREWGFGVTLPARWAEPSQGREAPESEADDDARAVTFKLEYESFVVNRVVGDGWPNTRDEIRWVSGGQSDISRAEPLLSQEWGGNDTAAGRTCVFGPFPWQRDAFSGAANKGVVLSVACWEWDTGDGNDNNIVERLMRLNNDPIFASLWAAVSAAAPSVLGFLMDVTSLAMTVVSWINQNDLSCARTLLLDRNAMAVLANRGTARWHFNGVGYHELNVKFTGGGIAFPVGTLEYAVRTRQGWERPVPLPWESISPPAMASFNGRLYVAFVSHHTNVMWTRLESDGTWRPPEYVGGDLSYRAPALCVAFGQLWYVVTGRDQLLYVSAFNELANVWSPRYLLSSSFRTDLAPSMAATPGRLWATHVGGQGRLYHRTLGGNEWSSPRISDVNWEVDSPVAMAPLGTSQVWRIGRGLDNKVYFMTSKSPTEWTAQAPTSVTAGWRTTHGLAAATDGDRTWAVRRGEDGYLRAADYTPAAKWGASEYVGGNTRATSMDEPAAAHAGKLYVMYRR